MAVGLVVASACEFGDLIESNPDAFRIVLEPSTAELEALGDTIRLSAELETADGLLSPRAKISWRSLDPEIATVSPDGLVRAEAVGTARIEASVSSLADTATITVRQKVASLSALPAGTSPDGEPPEEVVVELGDTLRFVAIARDRNGHEIPDVAVSWASLAPAVVSIDESGLATAHQSGDAKIVASAGDIADTVTVAVRQEAAVARVEITPHTGTLDAIGATLQLGATAYTADGSVVSGVRIVWTSLDSHIATVDTMGRVTAKAVGTALIVATAVCCGEADTAGIEVRQVVASLSLDRDTGTVGVGETLQLTATAADANGNPIPGAEIAWRSSDEAIAAVDETGLVRGVAPGEATIRAESGDQSAEAHITVSGGGGGGGGGGSASLVNECSQPGDGWIWCDDFDQDRLSQYFEYDERGGAFVRAAGVGIDGSGGMRARFSAGQVNAGNLKLAFGKTPSSYMRPVDAGTANYRDIYWRVYLRNAPDWSGGGGDKLARAIIFAREDWSEALIAHVWSGGSGNNYLVLDPASGTDEQGNVRTTGYNDFGNLRWLGAQTSSTPIFDAAHVGEWHCIESHVRVNDPGQSNGVFELWIDGQLEARATNLNWVGNYSAYGINALFLENYWNNGAPRQQERYFDNLVVSTQRIGCGGGSGGGGSGPAPVATVTVSPSSGTIPVDGTLQLTATLKDESGNTLNGRAVEWSSSNTGVATVTSGGLVRGVGEGTATITARSEGKSGSATITVTRPSQGGDPQPGQGDRILFDTRASLQSATSLQQAIAGLEYTSGIKFSRNFNGRGTNAYRIEWRGWGGTCSEQTHKIAHVFAGEQQGSSPRRIYMQWKMRMGRHPADTNTSFGAVNEFAITNPNCGTGGNAGRKMTIMGRGDPSTGGDAGNDGRTDVIWGGPAPSRFSVRLDTEGVARYANWFPEDHIAEDLTITVYYQAATAPGRSDGRIVAWVNGTKIMDTTAAMDVQGFRGFALPSVFNSPRMDQVEYIWDIVIWTPD
ncbi:MAG TPA: Ig-like domain-containing protein [Longimicrobiales bacterium]